MASSYPLPDLLKNASSSPGPKEMALLARLEEMIINEGLCGVSLVIDPKTDLANPDIREKVFGEILEALDASVISKQGADEFLKNLGNR